jgi:hypothetical protein
MQGKAFDQLQAWMLMYHAVLMLEMRGREMLRQVRFARFGDV